MDVYYAQHEYQSVQGRWASALADLRPLLSSPLLPALTMQVTAEDFTATVVYTAEDGALKPLHVRADSRLW